MSSFSGDVLSVILNKQRGPELSATLAGMVRNNLDNLKISYSTPSAPPMTSEAKNIRHDCAIS